MQETPVENVIELRPRIRRNIFWFILLIVAAVAIEIHVPEKTLKVGKKFPKVKFNTVYTLTPEQIEMGKQGAQAICGLIALLLIAKTRGERYVIKEQAIKNISALFSKDTDSIDMTHIYDHRVHESLINRLLGLGTLIIFSKDITDAVLKINGLSISDAQSARDFLEKFSVNSMVGEQVRRRAERKDA